jgi:hypothetical protein
MKKHEIEALKADYPELYKRALEIEAAALPNLKTVKGLGRNYSWQDRFGGGN